ncbi:MAG: hypothetical protein Fur0035_12090 [Anaerolineales bacterium]
MGAEKYGLWTVATSALGLMGVAEFGLNTAISKFLAEASARRPAEISAVVFAGLLGYCALGLGLTLPFFFFAPAGARFFHPSNAFNQTDIELVIRITSLGFFPLVLRSGAQAVPVGLQRFDLSVAMNAGYLSGSYLLALGIALAGGSVAQIVSGTVILLWLAVFISWAVAFRLLRPFRLSFSLSAALTALRRLFAFSAQAGLAGLGSQIFSVADRLTVGAVLGLEAAGYYAIISAIVTKILQLSGALTNALMPAVSSWAAAGNFRQVRKYFLRASALLALMNLALALALLAFSEPFLRLWLGAENSGHILTPFRILVIIYALISLNTPAYFVAYGLGKPGINAFAALAGGGLTILLIFVWGKAAGLNGAAFANGGFLVSWTIIAYVLFDLRKRTSIGVSK